MVIHALTRRLLLSLMMGLSAVPTVAHAVAEGAVLLLSGRVLLDDANRIANQKMAEVQNVGNGLVSQAVAGINVAIQGARINAAALLDRPLKELKESERAVFLSIRDATLKLDELSYTAYRLEEVANVDASMLLGAIPLVKDATFISSIRGLSILQTGREHRITVIGTGLGPGADGVVAKLDVLHGSKRLTPIKVDSSVRNIAVLHFAPETFAPHFKEDQVVTLPLVVKLTVTRKKWFGLTEETKEVASETPFSLYPPLLGRLTVSAEEPVFNWVKTRSDTAQWTMRDCGNKACGGGGVREEQYAKPGAEGNSPELGYRRIVNPVCRCGPPWWAPQACEYSWPLTCEVVENGTQVKVAWQVTGIWGTRYVDFDIETYQRTGTRPLKQTMDVRYGENVSFCLPGSTDFYRLVLQTLTVGAA